MQPVRPVVVVAPIAAVLLAACGALPVPPPSEIGGVPLTCVPATWERPPERVLGCGEAALVARGVLGSALPLEGIRFQHGPRCEPGLSEEAIRHLPPVLQGEERRRREAPCPALEPDLGLVRFTFRPVDGRDVPESYVKVELTEAGAVAVASEMLPWCEPPLDCERPGRP